MSKVIPEATKSTSFNHNLLKFLEQCKKVYFARHEASYAETCLGFKAINNFMKLYQKMKPEEFYPCFEIIFGQHRAEILETLTSDAWVVQKKLILKPPKLDVENFKVPVFEIYADALELRSESDPNLKVLADTLMLCMFRLFYFTVSESDRDAVGKILTYYEKLLNLSKLTVEQPESSNSGSSNQGLAGIFDLALNSMESFGFKRPDNFKAPTDEDFNKVLKVIFDPKNTKPIFDKMSQVAKNSNGNFGEAASNIVAEVLKPENIQSIQNTFEQTKAVIQQTTTTDAPAPTVAPTSTDPVKQE